MRYCPNVHTETEPGRGTWLNLMGLDAKRRRSTPRCRHTLPVQAPGWGRQGDENKGWAVTNRQSHPGGSNPTSASLGVEEPAGMKPLNPPSAPYFPGPFSFTPFSQPHKEGDPKFLAHTAYSTI